MMDLYRKVVDQDLAKVWKIALETGANVLALTVLEAAASSPHMIQERNELNAMIKNHQEDNLYVHFHQAPSPFSIIQYLSISNS